EKPPTTDHGPPTMDSCLFVLFGATGDLARKKLIPALYRGFFAQPHEHRLILLGTGRSRWADERRRQEVHHPLAEAGVDEAESRAWCDRCVAYACIADADRLQPVFERAAGLEAEHDLGGNRVYYLSLPPSAFDEAIETVGEHEREHPREGWARIVVEK